MLRFMKRERSDREEQQAKNGKASRPLSRLKGILPVRSGDNTTVIGSTGDDDDDDGSSSADLSDAWRAGNFMLDGSWQDDDWWTDDEEEEGSKQSSRAADAASKTRKRFRNRGLETWEKTRQAWKARAATTTTSAVVTPQQQQQTKQQPVSALLQKTPIVSRFRRRELQRNLVAERQFTLFQPMALKELIAVYTQIWSEKSEA